uniref:Uncharacterized protein n=1 Tax=Rhizobium rhizogenes TaxID=359 RepID=A0A7S4ZU35_RHIRH|nr:hypothetical protein [Rhizobium rhizogenes]QCL09436.1 hypothetical protein pC5.7c_569 [Rhizobium rhizogenes]QCL09605.1 hypothetical protein pC5.8a_113 [Rhizobium rhizogenes]
MGMMKADIDIANISEERGKQLAALARLVTYAREVAEELGVDDARDKLDIALSTLVHELNVTMLSVRRL